KQRQAGREHVAFAELEIANAVETPPEILRVRTADALGWSGRARGVENGERVRRIDRTGRDSVAARRQWRDRNVFARRRCRRIADQPNALQRRRVELDMGQRIQQLSLDDQKPRAGILQKMRKL